MTGCSEDAYDGTSAEQPASVLAGLTDEEIRLLPLLTEEDHSLSPEQAVEKAHGVLDLLAENEGPTTRSGHSRQLGTMRALTIDAQATRADGAVELPDTAAYLFNFADNGGYALISADRRVTGDVLAFSGEGAVADTVDNPGFALFLSYAEEYIASQITKFEREKDSVYRVILEKMGPEFTGGTTRATTVDVKINWIKVIVNVDLKYPLIPVEWDQGEPFNDKVKHKNGTGDAFTGCVPAAAAQLMTYWKYPEVIEGQRFEWDQMDNYTGYYS